ncbi:hypothetical protein FQA39_LY15455 [Lamprigera yunnana]|nr:hypothetical protein FQA39_LY15455 [Lamprigera yunnana]
MRRGCARTLKLALLAYIIILVIIPKIEILGESDIFVKSDSKVTLKCVITQSLEEPAYIFWYHDGERVLNYDRNAVDIRMERIGSDTTVSTLTIYHSVPQDSGNYTCSSSNLESSSVLLNVLNGEHPAAIQRGKNSAFRVSCWSHLHMGLFGFTACTTIRIALAIAPATTISQLLSV